MEPKARIRELEGKVAELTALVSRYSAEDAATRPDLLVPVPLHAQRLRERGYNQSLELARRLAPAIGLRIDAAALARARATAAQSELDAAARRRNVRDAFVADPARVRDRHIALIDDVATTAATAHECARALKLAGARDVSVYVIARAPALKNSTASSTVISSTSAMLMPLNFTSSVSRL